MRSVPQQQQQQQQQPHGWLDQEGKRLSAPEDSQATIKYLTVPGSQIP
jgi:hypothetical protein